MLKRRFMRVGMLAATMLGAAFGTGQAQEGWHGWGPHMMMGPGMMGSSGFGVLCTPQAAGLAEWQAQRIERSVRPNDEQKKKLADLRAASAKAAETVRASCTRELPRISTERMALMEKRMEGMLEALRTVRPAFDDFYNSLSGEQRTRFDQIGPRRWGWRMWRSQS